MSDAAPTTFSVVVTSYNYREYVREAVDGALAQRRAPLEVIVVDDGSSDGSPDLLRQHYADHPAVTLLTKPNGGQLSAFQHGVACARGDVVCFLDADDRWHPQYLACIGTIYDARGDIDTVFSDVTLIGDASGTQGYAPQALDLGCTMLATWVHAHWTGAPTSAMSLRRPLATRVLDLPPQMTAEWRISADNCLVFGASMLGARKYYLPTGAVDYRIHGRNGWWHEQSTAGQFPAKIRSRSLVNYYAQCMHLDPLALNLAKHEFLTHPSPDFADARLYAGLAMRAPAPWFKRVERALSILRRGAHASRKESS